MRGVNIMFLLLMVGFVVGMVIRSEPIITISLVGMFVYHAADEVYKALKQ